MKKRDFLKISSALVSSSLIPSSLFASLTNKKKRVRTAHIGVGQMGAQDLNSIASHKSVDVIALCDVDSNAITEASKLYPKAKTYKD